MSNFASGLAVPVPIPTFPASLIVNKSALTLFPIPKPPLKAEYVPVG